MTVKAISATILLGVIPLNVYQLPDGGYKVDPIGVMNAADKKGNALTRFINGKSPLALPFKGYNFTQAESVPVEGNAQFIKPIPIPLATAYWLYEVSKGNLKAQALVQASMAESIERRADVAFTIKRTEFEYNLRFGKSFESVMFENRQEVIERRLPGDDLYLPEGIN
ncbi:MAG: hypothetical protein MUE44_36930 [Oscillatoriaceae cyanobacterium Prado104]|jgi:hypothetical protein|nr:hypothetical protein [Oscillatoriaceae cyanobacterium Prado104]